MKGYLKHANLLEYSKPLDQIITMKFGRQGS